MKRPKSFKKTLKISIILILLAAVFLIANLTPAKEAIKGFFYSISSPVQKSLWKLGYKFSNFFGAIKEIKNLKNENESLKLKNQELISANAQIAELKKENETLRTALGIGLEKDFKLILAEITGKDISQDFILIDKGSFDGVSKGMVVITEQRALVGKVSEVYERFSRVILISNKEIAFDAEIQEREVSGVIKGQGDYKFFLDLIPKEKIIKEGDTVITTSIGGNFPKGILVGQIAKILKSDMEAFQKVKIASAFDIRKLDLVFIIIQR